MPNDPFEVQLLYGETDMAALVPGTKTFDLQPTGHVPLFGPADSDNPFKRHARTAAANRAIGAAS